MVCFGMDSSPLSFLILLLLTIFFEWCSCVSSGRRRLDDTDENVPEGDLKYHVSRSWNVTRKFGQISAVAIDAVNNVVIFHRGPNTWDGSTFTLEDVYTGDRKSPIKEETIYELDPLTGQEIRKWGDNMFFMPHGLSIDSEGNYWVTDVAMHQVLKFGPGRDRQPLLVLGEAFTPGSSNDHFCKPTSVAVHSKTREIFVADGYCNSRLMKFSPSGQYMMMWGEAGMSRKAELAIPHKVVLVEEDEKACISDREHGVIRCVKIQNKNPDLVVFRHDEWDRLFSISYAKCVPVDMIFAVTGPSYTRPDLAIEAYAVAYKEQTVFTHFAPHRPDRKLSTFSQPHDIVATKDCKNIYIVEIGPNLVWKFMTGFFGPNPEERNTSLISGGNTGQAKNRSVHSQYLGSFTVMISASSLVILIIFLLYRRSRQSRYGFSVNFLRRGMSNSRDSFDLGRLLEDPQKSGFNRVSTHDTDADMDGEQGSDSEVEEFNVSNVRINGLKV